jgi:hypothetical protein
MRKNSYRQNGVTLSVRYADDIDGFTVAYVGP